MYNSVSILPIDYYAVVGLVYIIDIDGRYMQLMEPIRYSVTGLGTMATDCSAVNVDGSGWD